MKLRGGRGDRRPPWIAGSMGDSGETMAVLRPCGGARDRAYCSLTFGGDELEGNSRGCRSAIDDSKSAIKTSIWLVSEGCRLERVADLGGLDRELALLCSLNPEPSDDWDSVGV